MRPEEFTALQAQRDKLTDTVAQLMKVINGGILRAGMQFTIERKLSKVPLTDSVFFSWFNADQIPQEITSALYNYCERLIRERAELNERITGTRGEKIQ